LLSHPAEGGDSFTALDRALEQVMTRPPQMLADTARKRLPRFTSLVSAPRMTETVDA
jgi:hypothetical protein